MAFQAFDLYKMNEWIWSS